MFFDFGIKDIIDIFLVATMLYYIYRLMRESRSLNVFIGIMVILVVWIFVSQVIEMRLLGSIMDRLASVGLIVLIVIFQDEIRKFLYNLGAHQRVRALKKFFIKDKDEREATMEMMGCIIPVVMATQNMSRGKVNVNQQLIENIFFLFSPLHDGAMVISKRRIRAAGCILPVSHDLNIPKELGLRHRAALGVSQESDSISVIVSEETGGISIAMGGKFRLRMTAEELESFLSKELA